MDSQFARDCRICIALRADSATTLRADGEDGRATMSEQARRRIVAAVFCTSLFSSLGIDAAANSARAADCLAAPNSPAPENSHWFYRTDRAQQRKCWYLGAAKAAFTQGSMQAAPGQAPRGPLPSKPAVSSYSLAVFKDFVQHRKGADWSDEDVERLYAEFLEWNHHIKN
jgi:hypothetical protein